MTTQHESTQHLGAFYGAQLSLIECEALVFSKINKRHLKIEPELQESCWWDYKPLHPVHRTYYFAHVYTQILRELFAQEVDFERAPYVKGWKGEDPLAVAQNAGSFWMGRQAADAIGARYSVFIRAAMKAHRDNGDSHRQEGKGGPLSLFARPNQLYDEVAITPAVQAWEDEKRAYFQLPAETSPFYLADSQFWARPGFETYLNDKLALSPMTGETELRPRLKELGFLG